MGPPALESPPPSLEQNPKTTGTRCVCYRTDRIQNSIYVLIDRC